MSLYLRKMAEDHIEEAKGRYTWHPSIDWYENGVLDVFTEAEANTDAALGRLTVICADLLELARRADPAYGLKPTDAA